MGATANMHMKVAFVIAGALALYGCSLIKDPQCRTTDKSPSLTQIAYVNRNNWVPTTLIKTLKYEDVARYVRDGCCTISKINSSFFGNMWHKQQYIAVRNFSTRLIYKDRGALKVITSEIELNSCSRAVRSIGETHYLWEEAT
jgi:hypothetical protein